jgi:hypothetical protein
VLRQKTRSRLDDAVVRPARDDRSMQLFQLAAAAIAAAAALLRAGSR